MQQSPQILRRRLEATCCHPAPGLLIHRSLAWKVIGYRAPDDAEADHVVQGVEHFAQRVVTLRRRLRHQGQILNDQRPFLAADVE